MREKLKNPPLIEAILEVKWKLSNGNNDPFYDVALGRLFEALKDDFPHYELLPTSQIPKEVSPYAVRHRFRKEKNAWPLFQLGPGILTFNLTEDYTTFDEFKPEAIKIFNCLLNAYSNAPLEICSLMLRYIDGVDFDYRSKDIIEFLKTKMGIDIQLPCNLFDGPVNDRAVIFSHASSYRTSEPNGQVTLKINTAERSGRNVLVWEQVVETANADMPDMPGDFDSWLTDAHKISSIWFSCLTEKMGLD